jgi:hypothetical protein
MTEKDDLTNHLQKTNPGLVSLDYYNMQTSTDREKFRKVGVFAIDKTIDIGHFDLPGRIKGQVRKCYY